MAVGFKYIITFNNNGKIVDYQKSYNNNYAKLLRMQLPLNMNNKKNYKAVLLIGINNTFPKQIETVIGYKDETDLNCYNFDVSEIYRKFENTKKIGLTRLKLVCDDNRVKFLSESFRM